MPRETPFRAKELASLLVLPVVPNTTKKHSKFFSASEFAIPLEKLSKFDSLGAHASLISHTPGLLLKAQGVTSALVDRFSGPSSLDHFITPFMALPSQSHLDKGLNLCRSAMPWLFLADTVPSFQTQPMCFSTHRLLTPTERSKFKSKGSTELYEVRALFLNLDLPALSRLVADLPEPVPALMEMVEKEFYSFSTMLSAKHPDSEFPLVLGSRLSRDPNSRASVDELETGTKLKAWQLRFKQHEDLLQLVLMLKSRVLKSGIMVSSESISAKISRRWI